MGTRELVLGLSVVWLAGCGMASEDAASDVGMGGPGTGSTPSGNNGTPGTLTAGAWDDNRNYNFYLDYLEAQAGLPGRPPFDPNEHDQAHARSAEATGRSLLDVALLIDATGSMGDEIAYLQTEFEALSSQIETLYPNAEQRWALVLYRDVDDDYLVKTEPFTHDLDAFRATLMQQGADGGHDIPEASEEGLAAAMELEWRGGDTSRLMFWVTDAPHHEQDGPAVAAAIRQAVERDVHIYPVAASGVDELAEYTMRAAAQLTLGRYLFLTDDSGVGNSHKEPSIPCYFVTRLDHAILRMIDIEMSGP